MFRKILASVLCLMLALAMPLTSLAATDVTVRIIPGAELASVNEAVGPALESLFLHMIAEDESAVLALESNKGEVVSAAVRGDNTGFYVSSPLLGERTLYFTMEDIAVFMGEMMKQSGASEAEIAEFQQAMAQMAAPNMATMQASQNAQNALIQQGFSDEVDALYNRLNSCPVPTTPVYGRTPIFTCGGNGCGGNNGFMN